MWILFSFIHFFLNRGAEEFMRYPAVTAFVTYAHSGYFYDCLEKEKVILYD